MSTNKSSIQVSKQLLNKIVDPNFKNNFESMLVQKSGDKCFLCQRKFNYASDDIQVDHDIPESQNGATDYNNLNLVHESCNKFKRDNSSLLVKKYLPFKIFIEENPKSKYNDVAEIFFQIKPANIVTLLTSRGFLKLHFSNGTETPELPIYEEKKPNGSSFKFVFAQVPVAAINNDAVQPRAMKPAQVFKIFQDLHENPLHEPSSVRLKDPLINNAKNELLMFDGQHKTVAKMLVSDSVNSMIDLKIYLDLSLQQATALVNTIQSKIIKLGLTKSEFAAKMGDEFKNDFQVYLDYCSANSTEPSEDGFISFTPKSKQANNKKTLMSSRLNSIIDQSKDALKILNMIEGKSDLTDKKSIIKETTFINKLVKPFMYEKPLKSPIENDEKRSLELENINLILNVFYEICLSYDPKNCTSQQLEKIHRLKSQSALNLFVTLMKACYNHLFVSNNDSEILTKRRLDDKKDNILKVVQLYCDHPIWIQDEGKSKKTQNFYNTLQKNGSLLDIADSMGLKPGYLVGADQLTGKECE
jgi:hypothetical protein